MRDIPSSVLHSWPKPNYIDPETRGDSIIIISTVFLAAVVTAVTFRIFTRLIVKKAFGLDDVFILLSLVSELHHNKNS